MTRLELDTLTLELERFPPPQDASLQAWDAADEYLMRELPQDAPTPPGPVLVFNDGFGALACWLHGRQPICISDSWLSQVATRQNLVRNGLDPASVRLLDALAPLPAAPAWVIIKVPKTLALLEHQLLALRSVVSPGTRILAAAKARDIHGSTLALFERILGPVHTSLAWKKARLIRCEPAARDLQPNPYPSVWPLEQTPYRIHNHANVYSRASLDIGARFFLEHLPAGVSGQIADLGCGNGVIGLTALALNPEARLLFIDESYMAVDASRLNVQHNRPDDLARCEFRVNHSLDGIADGSLDLVLCNPPFHQQQAITDHLAWQMFRDAHRCLKPGGELRIIGNRHLGYHIKLQRLFGQQQHIASNRKFVIFSAIKH